MLPKSPVRVVPANPTPRGLRRPQHTFQVRARPYAIVPFMIAPVLPGDTLKNLLIQARVVTDPIANPIIGWWHEYYVFYVKHRDLAQRDTLTALMLNPETDMTALRQVSASVPFYTSAGAVKYVEYCLQRITEEYFRDEGEAWNNFTINGYPAAGINTSNWMDSLVLDDDIEAVDDPLPDEDAGVGTGGMQELDSLRLHWEQMRALKLINMDYEDWLAQHGIRPKSVELHKPELVRYVKEWSYPSNTIDPTNGAPRSAVSWGIAERADKDRFFKEPGFLFGVTVTRPKVYFSKPTGALAGFLDGALSWLPAIMRHEKYTSLRKFAQGAGPLPAFTDTNGYWLDLRDLFLYGDQFTNIALASATADNSVPYPLDSSLQWKYPTDIAHVTSLFVATGTADTDANYVKQDGVCSLSILSVEHQDAT